MSRVRTMQPGMKTERVMTAGMKRRGVVKVLKSALLDAQRETGPERTTGIFGVIVKEDGTVGMLSALTITEMRLVMKAVPTALNAIAMALAKGQGEGH